MLIIPTYNEAENINSLVQRIRRAAGDIPIFFIDDNSPDGTAGVIRALQKDDSQIYLKLRSKKQGLGSAYREGFAEVIQSNLADYVIAMDADLSHPPEVIPQIQNLLKEYDVVIGSRYTSNGAIENWNLWRRVISRSGNIYAQLLVGTPINDLTAGLVGYRVESLKKIDLSSLKSEGYAFQIEIKYLLHRQLNKIYEHPITFIERRGGKSKFSSRIVREGIVFPFKIFLKRLLWWNKNDFC